MVWARAQETRQRGEQTPKRAGLQGALLQQTGGVAR